MTGTAIRFVLVSTLAMILVVSIISPAVIAAGNTDVALSPESNVITPGSTTTVDIVVTNATDGVGAVNVTVSLTPGDAATITEISLDDSAYSGKQRTNTDNTSVTVVGFGLDTNESGSVVVGDLIISGDTSGSTNVSLQVNGLGDESGSDYTIDSVDGTSISITSGSGGGGGGGSPPTTTTDTSTATPTPTPTSTPTPTPTVEPSTPTATETTGSDAPGFGPIITLGAFLSAVVLVLRQYS